MNIKIDLNNLDDAIKQIEDFKTRVENFTADIATEARDKVGYSKMSVVHEGGTHTIIASGSDGDDIAFAEWGAGYTADMNEGFEQLGGDPFVTYPGAWSESHERTFQHHQASGKDPSTYRYNRRPLRRMEKTAVNIHYNITQKARDYFK